MYFSLRHKYKLQLGRKRGFFLKDPLKRQILFLQEKNAWRSYWGPWPSGRPPFGVGKEKAVWSRVPSVPHAASARMPRIQEAQGPQMMGLEFSSSQAASGIQFPSSPTPESVPDKFLSSFAITIQVYIFKKAEGHGAVCKRQCTPFPPGTTLSHYLLEDPGTPG